MQLRRLPYADPGEPDLRSGPRFLLWLLARRRGGQLAALGWGLLLNLAVTGLPLGVGLAVQAVVDGSGRGLLLAAGLLALLGGALTLGDVMLHRTAVVNWIAAATRVQQLLARKAAELGAALTRRVAAGEVVAVSTADVEKIGWFVEAVSRFAASAVTLVVLCAGLVVYVPELGTVVALAVPVLALAPLPLLPRATRRADEQREKAGRATELATDTVAGLRVLRGIGGEELFLSRYRAVSQEVRRAAVRSARSWALIAAVQVALPGLLLIGVVVYGARLALDGRIAVGELVTVYGAVLLVQHPLRQFEEIAMAYSFSRPSARRAVRVLALARGGAPVAASGASPSGPHSSGPSSSEPSYSQQPPSGPPPPSEPPGGGDRHGGAVPHAGGGPLGGDLRDPVSGVVAPAGRLTALVCGDPDAAGRLAERLGGHPAEPGEGHRSVRLGGVALDGVPLARARAAVLVQDKDPVLLSGTLRELLDVPSSGAVDAGRALEAAHCGDVLDALAQAAPEPGGDPMDTRITERGRSLSGGQRQRLALARSLVADPDVLVLDEPTSAVDAHTEARVAQGVRRLREGRTTVVLTSSPLLLDAADRVVLVHGGAAVAAGTHRELLRTEPRYRAVVSREEEPRPDAGGEKDLVDIEESA
ncbi:ABC transporter ATP-binding protein [Streptomyces fradiae]|uniref:ABC transporter ATP-binding protein n=1 Tax=Streptomyces fradiae TaxID=1906 RepID=UPI00341056E8